MSIFDNMIERLTSVYNKTEDSNLSKLIKIISEELSKIKEENNLIKEAKNINNASGETLDNIGSNVQQSRGGLGDEKFRLLIKAKISRNISGGTPEDLMDIISTIFEVDYDKIIIQELYNDEPASIYLSVPVKPIGEIGLTRNQFLIIVNKILSAGVRPYTILEGSFQYTIVPSERTTYDYNHGYSNLYDDALFALSFDDYEIMSTYLLPGKYNGGQYSSWYNPADITELPGWN